MDPHPWLAQCRLWKFLVVLSRHGTLWSWTKCFLFPQMMWRYHAFSIIKLVSAMRFSISELSQLHWFICCRSLLSLLLLARPSPPLFSLKKTLFSHISEKTKNIKKTPFSCFSEIRKKWKINKNLCFLKFPKNRKLLFFAVFWFSSIFTNFIETPPHRPKLTNLTLNYFTSSDPHHDISNQPG